MPHGAQEVGRGGKWFVGSVGTPTRLQTSYRLVLDPYNRAGDRVFSMEGPRGHPHQETATGDEQGWGP